MFEKIRFTYFEGNYDTASNRKDKLNEEMIRIYGKKEEGLSGDTSFSITGKTSFILGRPMDPVREDNLVCLQSFSYMETRSGYYTKRSAYPSILLCYTYEGEGELVYRGKTYNLRPKDLFVIDCGDFHEYYTIGEKWTQCSLHFFGGNALFLYQQLFQENGPVFHYDLNLFQPALEEILLMHNSNDPLKDYRFSILLSQLLLDLHQNEMKQNSDAVFLLQDYIDAHFTEDLSLDTLAREASLSKYHLHRRFKETFGMTPKAYINALRMRQAGILLIGSDLPSYKIGMIVGYPSEAIFISQFKRHYHMTPGQYRKSVR